jgi:hypothetical protein
LWIEIFNDNKRINALNDNWLHTLFSESTNEKSEKKSRSPISTTAPTFSNFFLAELSIALLYLYIYTDILFLPYPYHVLHTSFFLLKLINSLEQNHVHAWSFACLFLALAPAPASRFLGSPRSRAVAQLARNLLPSVGDQHMVAPLGTRWYHH